MLHPALLLAVATATAAPATPDLFDGFAAGWRAPWREQRLFARLTLYAPMEDGGRLVLHARSEAANAGLLREVRVAAPARAQLGWRWKVPQALTGNDRERTRAGDDYAARVFVVFETSLVPLRTRAINYVWSACEPAGAVFANPYSSQVAMIVLRSGGADAGAWRTEHRDVLADYRAFFSEPPREITAVAVMADTDNTGLAAEAWFADLRLATTPP